MAPAGAATRPGRHPAIPDVGHARGGPFRRHVALPADHGAWALLVAPLAIGLCAGGRWTIASVCVVAAALCAFLVRQPITLAVKVRAGRRSRDVLPAVGSWIAVYAAIGLAAAAGLVTRGFGYLLWMVPAGATVFLWHLLLVARRRERRQWPVETLAAGALALGAPAGFWVGLGRPDPVGWLLWILCWGQSVSWIAHAYSRLAARERNRDPAGAATSTPRRWSSVAAAVFPLGVALAAGLAGVVSRLLWIAFTVQFAESVWGAAAANPLAKPRAIGFRQLVISVVQTGLFILLWPT